MPVVLSGSSVMSRPTAEHQRLRLFHDGDVRFTTVM